MLNRDQARVRSFEVIPSLPEPLKPLLDIANNLWWSWHPEAVELYQRLDRDLWEATGHNPVRLLGSCAQETLDRAARDEGFLTTLARAEADIKRHLKRTPWLEKQKAVAGFDPGTFTVAYFCAEFGLTECLRIYSGGLGLLAGDHLKSASELGVPLVAVGLLYRNGYFQQYLNSDGWQQEYTPDLDFVNLPISRVTGQDGNQLKVTVNMPGRDVHAAVWQCLVGRIKLFLLDTSLPENDPVDRAITGQLYGGDMEMRIKQEIVLGIGGVHALSAMGIQPDVFHMNEGHSAFLALERVRRLIAEHNITFDEARQYAAAGNVFTTHTPVPAGIDRFPPEMIQRYFKGYHEQLRLDMEGLLALGRENVFAKNEFFSMAILALRNADWRNGVSKLHGDVSRTMWKTIWPGLPEDEVPITHVTNGVHARSWLSRDFMQMLDRYLGARRWQDDPADHTVWHSINEVPDEELWRIRDLRRHRLIVWVRQRLRKQLQGRGENADQIRKRVDALRTDALTIGFARRFATYKRGTLLLHDVERFKRLLNDSQRPIQFIVAGKAHPADGGGKDLIRQIVHFAHESEAGHRIVFLENYNIDVARYLVQGCDVWLNTPRRGMEASGTSGMKAAMNGVLNCSILDGWWDEAYENDLGWAIGRGEAYANVDTQDQIESQSLYDLFEKQIVPMFYSRDASGIPTQWVERMKRCISQLAPRFNTNRMVQDYLQKLYVPAVERSRMLGGNKLSKAIELAHFKDRLRAAWSSIRILDVEADTNRPIAVREKLPLRVSVHLDGLKPEDIRVQVYAGSLDNDGHVVDGQAQTLHYDEDLGDQRHRFVGTLEANTSGQFGFAVRIVPGGELMRDIPEPGLILWDADLRQQQQQGDVPVISQTFAR
jgi:starch phosphorylase